MKKFGFLLGFDMSIGKGIVTADNEEEARELILDGDYDDIIDKYEADEIFEEDEIIEIWEININN